MKNKQGFTLIELLVVITIIGLLSTLAVFALNSASMKARDAKRMSDLKIISQALEVYNINNDDYPIIDGANNIGTCGEVGVIAGDAWFAICQGYDFKDSSTTYLTLPVPPKSNVDQYYWVEYYGKFSGYPAQPCIYTYSMETGPDESGGIYICQGGNCEYYDGQNWCPNVYN